MNRISRAQKFLLAIWASFLITFISEPIVYAQTLNFEASKVHVKFKEEFKPKATVQGKTSGVAKVDLVSEKFGALSIKRIFPEAGIFEESHKAYGLHLWYEIEFRKDTALRKIVKSYFDTDYFEIVEESKPYFSVHKASQGSLLNMPSLPSGTNDPHFIHQWHLNNTGQVGGTPGSDINLLNAWKVETGSPNVIVAVLDGGIDKNHPDLKESLWVNSGEIPGNNKDDDFNGYVDDIHGFGFGDGIPIIYPDDHATHVAGIIGAVTNNEIGISGIAGGNGIQPGVRLMSCATFGSFRNAGFEQAMVYAADNGAVISQNSWGGGSTAIEAAINYFISRAGLDNSSENFSKNIQTGPMAGGVVIFAAGNSNTNDPENGYPASYEKVIAVASTDNHDLKSYFSNFGTWVDISAPGSNIYSAVKNGGYERWSGTSMACPHVSGVAALIVSNIQRVGLRPNEVWNRLRFSARSINANNLTHQGLLGWGRLDAAIALKEPDIVPPGAITDLHLTKARSSSLTLTWTASGESNEEGQAAEYEIRYSKNPIDQNNFSQALLATNPPVPPMSGEQVIYNLTGLEPNTNYYVAVRSIDVFNFTSTNSNILVAQTLKLPTPELITTQLSKQLYTGTTATDYVLIKNSEGAEDLIIRAGVPEIQAAPVLPPLSEKSKLFVINTALNTIDELEPQTGKLVKSLPMPEPSSKTVEGLAFDGKYLFYGKTNKVYKIDAISGEIVRVINLDDFSTIRGLAWSGRYLYVSGLKGYNYATFELDTDNGSIIRSIATRYSELAFYGANNSLLFSDLYGIVELDVQTSNFIRSILAPNIKSIAYSIIDDLIFTANTDNTIRAIRPSDGEEVYRFPLAISTTALASHENQHQWIETTEQIITIPMGQTGQLPITFVSSGLNQGVLTGSLKIIPLNPAVPKFLAAVSLSVTPAADIETASEINFGKEFLEYPVDTTIYVANRGFFDLNINQIQSSNAQVVTSASSLILSPGQKAGLKVSLIPTVSGIIDAHLTLRSNDPDEGIILIPVRSDIYIAPKLNIVTPESIQVTLNPGETTTVPLILNNSGGSPLTWNLNLTGSGTNQPEQSGLVNPEPKQNIGQHLTGANNPNDPVTRNSLDQFVLKANSPEPLTCLSYDPIGGLIYARGFGSSNFFSYNPTSDTWTTVGLVPGNFDGQATYLNGKIYHGGSELNVYTIQSQTWSSIPFPTSGIAVSLTNDDRYLYIAIGNSLYRFDSASENWLELALPPNAQRIPYFGALSHHSGIIYCSTPLPFAGDGNTPLYKYIVASNRWINTNSISGTVRKGSAIDATGHYYILGNSVNSPYAPQLSILDIRTAEWERIWLPTGTADGVVFVNKEGFSGIYLLGSGTNFGHFMTPSVPNWFATTPSNGRLLAAQSQTISLTLNSQGLFGGEYNGDVRVYSEHPELESRIPLELTVLGTPEISINNDSIDLQLDVVVGYDSGWPILVRNKGTAELVINSISSSGSDFIAPDGPFEIPIGEAINIFVYFRPSNEGPQSGQFILYSNDPQRSQIEFRLSGTGIFPAELQVQTDTIKATLITGGHERIPFTVTNVGNGPTMYLAYWTEAPWMKTDFNGYPQNIQPQSARDFYLDIHPLGLSEGMYHGNILVEDYRDPSYSQYTIPVVLTVINAPDLLAETDSINFGRIFLNKTVDSLVQIKNVGVLPLTISAIEIDNSPFSISTNIPAPLTLNPGESIDAQIRFNPAIAGFHETVIKISTDDPDEGLSIIKLAGNAIAPPILNTDSTQFSFSIYSNESQTTVLNINNRGGSELNWKVTEYSAIDSSQNFLELIPAPSSSIVNLFALPDSELIYGLDFQRSVVRAYNEESNSWSENGSLPYFGSLPTKGGVTILNSKLYYVFTESPTLLHVYDLNLKSWSTKVNQLGAGTSTITTDGTLLYLGGSGKFMSYNPLTNIWLSLSVPTFTLSGSGGFSFLDGYIYAHNSDEGSFARYSIATGIWNTLIPVPDISCIGSTIDPIRMRYYTKSKHFIYEYDIAANIWTAYVSSVFEMNTNSGLIFSNNRIYFLEDGQGMGFARFEPKNKLSWLRSSPLVGNIDPQASQGIGINVSPVDLAPGVYQGKINVMSNDPESLSLDIPVTLEIKDPSPIISLANETISANAERNTVTEKYFVIKNDGKNTLEWHIDDELPIFFSISNKSGSIPGFSKDSLKVTFNPELFNPVIQGYGTLAHHHFQIESNDPERPITTASLYLYVQNSGPILINPIPPQNILTGSLLEIALPNHFSDPDQDSLYFSIETSTSSFITAGISGDKLTLKPIGHGLTNVSVTARDPYNTSITTSFSVNVDLVTAIADNKGHFNLSANPNPFKNKIKVRADLPQNSNIELYLLDFIGRTAWRSNDPYAFNEEIEIDTSNLAPGLYTCIVMLNHKIIGSLKVLKE